MLSMLILFAACANPSTEPCPECSECPSVEDSGDSGDSGVEVNTAEIVDFTTYTDEYYWFWTAETFGPVAAVELVLRPYHGDDETHPLPLVSSDGPYRSWSVKVGIAAGGEYKPGAWTHLQADGECYAWILRSYDDEGELLECFAWGEEIGFLQDEMVGCKVIEGW